MGTRSTTTIHEDGKPLLTFYRQYDGYPTGHGQELVDFLKTIKMVNGIPVGTDEPMQMANGGGCLAAQMIVHFKTGITNYDYSKQRVKDSNGLLHPVVREGDHAGGIYIVPNEEAGHQAYHYDVFIKDRDECTSANITISVKSQPHSSVEYELDEYDGKQIEDDWG